MKTLDLFIKRIKRATINDIVLYGLVIALFLMGGLIILLSFI